MQGILTRKTYEDKQTLGEFKLYEKGKLLFSCYTLELPWKNNQFQVSCIPKGEYEVVPRTSAKFKNHFHILDVPNRTYILFHSGNYYTQILGCVLLGDSLKDINSDGLKDVTNSKNTMKKLLKLAPKGFKLTIN